MDSFNLDSNAKFKRKSQSKTDAQEQYLHFFLTIIETILNFQFLK